MEPDIIEKGSHIVYPGHDFLSLSAPPKGGRQLILPYSLYICNRKLSTNI